MHSYFALKVCMFSPLHRWLKIVLFNLLLIAAIGLVLRYKITYSLPFIDQKHLLHGHSHFAFAGWISQAIMTLMVAYLAGQNGNIVYKKYRWLLWGNLLTAYGMLITFPIQGYGLFSIIFSTASIFTGYVFVWVYWKDLNRLTVKHTAHLWFKTALFCNAVSSLGAFALAVMMVKKIIHQNWYLGAQYFYLHFQYNGWFFFACMGLLTAKIFAGVPGKILNKIFRLFAAAIIPAYFLSALWMDIPLWIYALVIIAAVTQVTGWVYMIVLIRKVLPSLKHSLPVTARWLFILSAAALTVKLLLQLGSTVPALSTLAFGFRPIVIGYLHLVLLGVITLFLIGYMFAESIITINKKAIAGAGIFAGGIIINEVFLMTQGVAALDYINIPFINESLLVAALIMFTGTALLNISQQKNN